MHPAFEAATAAPAIPITFVTVPTWPAASAALSDPARRFAAASGFAAKAGDYLALPDASGEIPQVLCGLEAAAAKSRDPFRPGQLPGLLPAGLYRFANAPHDTRLATLAFALGSYRFNRYRKSEAPEVRLVAPHDVDVSAISRMAEAATLARDLINTPS